MGEHRSARGGRAESLRADAIVVAAGSSRRMGGRDKLAAPLLGRSVLAWAVEAVAAAPEVARVVIVGPREAPRLSSSAARKLVGVVPGGPRRQDSVAAGFAALEALGVVPDERIVLIHDGARPLVSPRLVSAVVLDVAEHGAAIPVVPIAETVKRVDGESLAETVDRTHLVTAQTPQGARAGLLRSAWRTFPASGAREFTDEASLLEACTIPVHPTPGDPVNLKVTLPADLRRAEAFLASGGSRTGSGWDSHPFGPGTPLRLGGIEIPGAPALHGHSDGDVALHAVADALLGAAGLGDLGRLFPSDTRTARGIASTELIRVVADRLAAAGWRPISVDLTIVGARPKLGERLVAMQDAVAALLGLDPSAVSVKASTGNLDGASGAGRVISAHALATIGSTGTVGSDDVARDIAVAEART